MNLFAYGTLLVPRIWEAVTGIPPGRTCEANLPGYQIFRIREGDFPGIVETGETRDTVSGRIFFDLSPDVIDRLDRYEDAFYERVDVSVLSVEGTDEAQTYRIPRSSSALLLTPEKWTLHWFEEEALPRYWERLFG